MKIFFYLCLFFTDGVIGETYESVLVNEGDSVTLHSSFTEIHKGGVIDWRFGAEGILIAKINGEDNKYSTNDDVLSGRFKDRLKLDHQNGDLTIRNIRFTDSGVYEVTNATRTFKKIFSVNAVSADKIQSVSVLVGDSVTLHTDVPDIQIYDMIRWRFEHHFIAEINRTAEILSTSDGANERFGHKLQLEYWTASLTISNIETSHSGIYEVNISSSKHTIHKTFTVNVSGEMKSVSVIAGDSITLQTNFTNIQIYDFILWMFGGTVIADIYKTDQQFYINDVADGRFRERLNLDHQTGSLTITNSKSTDSGLYELKISCSRHSIHKRFTVTVNVSLNEEDSVTLKTDAEMQKDDQIRWTFRSESSIIAEIKGGTTEIFFGPDGRFRDRLKLDHQTGSLTITNTRIEDTGKYELKFIRRGKTSYRSFKVTVSLMKISVKKGDSVTLKTDTEIQEDDQILWILGITVIAKIVGGTKETFDGADRSFRNRLKLDKKTGSLTIRNTRYEDSGYYKLQMIRSGKVSNKTFSVTISDNTAFRENKPEDHQNVPLMSKDTSNIPLYTPH